MSCRWFRTSRNLREMSLSNAQFNVPKDHLSFSNWWKNKQRWYDSKAFLTFPVNFSGSDISNMLRRIRYLFILRTNLALIIAGFSQSFDWEKIGWFWQPLWHKREVNIPMNVLLLCLKSLDELQSSNDACTVGYLRTSWCRPQIFFFKNWFNRLKGCHIHKNEQRINVSCKSLI